MFAIRTWAKVDVDLTSLKAGRGLLGDLPAASLPIVAAVLAGFFELDNTGDSKKDEAESKGAASKGASGGKQVRVADAEEAEEEEEEEAPAKTAERAPGKKAR
jgi:hypothetical protein